MFYEYLFIFVDKYSFLLILQKPQVSMGLLMSIFPNFAYEIAFTNVLSYNGL